MEVLKHNAKRTVRLEADPACVIKRFHAGPLTDRWRDRFRARREFLLLGVLRQRGLAVPEPLELRHRDGRWELVTAYLAGATRLSDLARGRAPAPIEPRRLASALGAFLAQLHAAGVDHGDLHPGNVLVDSDGKPWLCDLAHARTRSALPRRVALRDLGQLGAGLRSLVPIELRARFLGAYRRALPGALRERFDPLDPLALEDAARARRKRDEERATRRWLRASSSTLVAASPDGDALVAREDAAAWGALRRAVDQAERGVDGYFRVPYPGRADLDLCGYADWKREQLEPVWRGDARLWSHDVPCARPLAFLRSVARQRSFAAYAVPGDSRSLLDAFEAGSSAERLALACALGHTLGRLHDAGLTLRDVGIRHFFARADDVLLRPCTRPVDLDPRRRADAWEEPARVLAWSAAEHDAFLASYADAHAHSRSERARLRRELARG